MLTVRFLYRCTAFGRLPALILLVAFLAATPAAQAEKTIFHDQVTGCEIWRMTDTPGMFYTHTYVEIPSIDPTGRWVAFHGIEQDDTHREKGRTYVADLVTGEVQDLGLGSSPLWDLSQPMLYFWRKVDGTDDMVMRADPAAGSVEAVVACPTSIRGTTVDGRCAVFVADNAIKRVELKSGAEPEVILSAPPGIRFGGHMRHNPTRPWCFIIAQKEGQSLNGPCFVVKDDGSEAHRYDWFGEYIGHMSWSADGSGMLRANVPWPAYKPFPLQADTPWRTLAVDEFWPNHIGCLGKDERLVATDNDNQSLYVTDTLTRHSSRLCYVSGFSVPYSKDGDPHAVGSPDGTKLQFDSCYDLRDHGLTVLSRPLTVEADTIAVVDTAHFPDEGLVMLGKYGHPEFVHYEGKSPTGLLNCERGCLPKLYESSGKWQASAEARAHREGTLVTEYLGRFQTPGVRRGPDIYVAVVRDPAPPRALTVRRTDSGVEISWEPPELHHEIAAYRVERSSESGRGFATITRRVEETRFIDASGPEAIPLYYRVVSLERSGLESTPSWEAVCGTANDAPAQRRLFREAEHCSMVGQGGLEFSSGCYGRTYVASKSSWLAVPFTLSREAACAVWLRMRTPQKTGSLSVWSIRQHFTCKAMFSSPNGFSWQRLVTESGDPVSFPAEAGENTITLQARDMPYDVDRICITDDLDFVPPDEPNAKLPAPQVTAEATGPHSTRLTWRLPGKVRGFLYEIREADSQSVVASTQESSYLFDDLRLNSEQTVQVIPINRFGTPGEASAKVVCRPKLFELVREEIEAEACSFEFPMVSQPDLSASSGQAVVLSYRGRGRGTVRFEWAVPVSGEYLLAVRTRAYWPGQGSFSVTVDQETVLHLAAPTFCWNWQPVTPTPTPQGTQPSWIPIQLSKGRHIVEVSTETDGLLLDKFLVCNDVAWRPAGSALPSQPVDVAPMPRPGREVLIPLGGQGCFTLRLRNRQSEAMSCRVRLICAPDGITVTPPETTAELPSIQNVPLAFRAVPDKPGRHGYAYMEVSAGQWQTTVVIPIRALSAPITLIQAEAEDASLPPDAEVKVFPGDDGTSFVEFDDGTLLFNVVLPKEADYTVWVRQFAPVGGFGYFGQVDGGESFRIIGPWEKVLERWCWLTSPRVPRHHWPAGRLQLRIKRRGESYRRIDRIVITDDPDYEPGW